VVEGDLIIVVGNGRLQLRAAADPDEVLNQTTLAGGSYASRVVVRDNILTVIEAGGPSGIQQFDISNPANPVALGDLAAVELFFLDQAVANDQAFFAAGTFGEFGHCSSEIHAIRLDSGTPQLATTFDPQNCITGLAVQENTLYVAGRSGLQLYDVSDPAGPTLQGHFTHPDGFHDAQGLALHEEVAYLLTAEGRSFDILTLDLDQPSPVALSSKLTLDGQTLLDLFVTGDTLIAPVWMGGLNTLDISDPAAPQILRRPAEGEMLTGDLYTVLLNGDVLYTPVVDNSLVGAVGVVDLSDPANPALATIVETQNPQVLSLALGNDTLYVLSQGQSNQVHIYDVSQPLEPQPAGVVTLPEAASRLAVVGNTLYAACDKWNCQSLYSLDVADPQNPSLSGQWQLPFGVQEMITNEDGTLYLVSFDQGLWLLNAVDPDQPYLAGNLQLASEYVRLEVTADRLYAAAYDAGLYVIEVNR
jgi:hypothetical protein